MKPGFELAITSIEVTNELPGTWTDENCRTLLAQLDFAGVAEVPDAELRDYAVMALQDLTPEDAAAALLEFVFGDALSAGKKQNLSEEMCNDRCWEEYSDLGCHERIFNAQVLLHQAHPSSPQPEVNAIEAVLTGLNAPAEQFLQHHGRPDTPGGIPESLIVRCMAAAQPDNAILNRLFEDQIHGAVQFAEAKHILWHVDTTRLPAAGERSQRYRLFLYSPPRWTGDLAAGITEECTPFVRELDDDLNPGVGRPASAAAAD